LLKCLAFSMPAPPLFKRRETTSVSSPESQLTRFDRETSSKVEDVVV
jgi:hypothetical protein